MSTTGPAADALLAVCMAMSLACGAQAAGWIWGVTTDDPTVNTAQQADALAGFRYRPMLRAVFDPPDVDGHPVASDYTAAVTALAGAADLMGQPVDSSLMPDLDAAAIQARMQEYLDALGSRIRVWEVGNEVNGDWLGPGVVPKVEAMYDATKAAGKLAALTFYHEYPTNGPHDVLAWTDANLPPGHRMRAGLDFVFVSYYEDANSGHMLTQPELDALFGGLASRFPNARVGFGEFGWEGTIPADAATRAALIQRFYGYRVPSVPHYQGGGFYWHFRQTMVPRTQSDWAVLAALIDASTTRPTLRPLQAGTNAITLALDGMTPMSSNDVQRCTTLESNDWRTLGTFVAATADTNWTDRSTGAWSHVFYRVTSR